MPSPFSQNTKRLNKKALKPGSLMYDLREINRDIRKHKRGEETEESLEVMKDARRRYKKAIKDEGRKEDEAMRKDMNPLQLHEARESKKMETAEDSTAATKSSAAKV